MAALLAPSTRCDRKAAEWFPSDKDNTASQRQVEKRRPEKQKSNTAERRPFVHCLCLSFSRVSLSLLPSIAVSCLASTVPLYVSPFGFVSFSSLFVSSDPMQYRDSVPLALPAACTCPLGVAMLSLRLVHRRVLSQRASLVYGCDARLCVLCCVYHSFVARAASAALLSLRRPCSSRSHDAGCLYCPSLATLLWFAVLFVCV